MNFSSRGRDIVLSLIGMSGSGKTYWSDKLAECGFQRVSCDELIEERLAPELPRNREPGVRGMADWMGPPESDGFREREAHYLTSEIEVVRDVIRQLEKGAGPAVIDTTGSFVYLGDAICRRLRGLSTIVYLEASSSEHALLIERYLQDPKPVIWGEHFSRDPGESLEAAIARCYPQLLAYRKGFYEKYAHVRVPIAQLRGGGLDGYGFLEFVKALAAHGP